MRRMQGGAKERWIEAPPYETIHHLLMHNKQDERGTQAGVTRRPPYDMIHYLVRHKTKGQGGGCTGAPPHVT